MSSNPRKIASDIIYDVLRNGKSLSEELIYCRKKYEDLTQLDINFVSEITGGVIRNLEYIDCIISKSSDIRINKISPYILSVLRTGVYQLVFMDKVPVSAAVNECVKLAKKSSNHRLSGFVNAVLRKADRIKDECIITDNTDSSLSVKYSCPEWIINKLRPILDEDIECLLAAFGKKAETILRVNKLKTTRSELIKALTKNGWECKEYNSSLFPEIDYLISVNKIRNLEQTAEYLNGYFYIQDPAAAYVGEILKPAPGSVVFDMCASPGGKTTHFAEVMGDEGKIFAFDVSENKISKICENTARLGINSVHTGVHNALEFNESFVESADYLLVDAPCSGMGIVRKKPDIKYHRKEEDIASLAEKSLAILNTCASYLKVGGTMVFSTCTIFKEENEDVLFRFISAHPEFELKPIKCSRANDGYITLYPHRDNCDGFFIALITRNR